MARGRKVALIATSTVLSVALAVAVNVATGGSLPEPLDTWQWLAWPLVGALALAVIVVGLWQAGAEAPDRERLTRPVELPPAITRFAGRETDLALLLDAVPARPTTGLGAPVMLGIFGAGGMGKTVLATRVAHTVAARYPDGQVFVELRGASSEPADPGEVVRRVLHALGVPAADVPAEVGARVALYRTVLASRRVLLYLDDAGSEDQVRPLLPAGRGCLVVVTARPSLVGLGLAAWCNLDVLPEAEALELLALIAADEDRVQAEPAAAVEIVRHCGYLPLAVSIAGGRLRSRPHWTLADLAARLADERRRLDELQVGNHDVRASIGLSYGDLDPVASRLFRRLSLLGHVNFGPGVAAALLGGKHQWPRSETTLEHLADVKLVEVAGPRRYRFHDLVRLYAGERLDAEEPADERKAALLRSLDYYLTRTREQWACLTDPSADDDRRVEAELWFGRTRELIVAAVQAAEEAGERDTAKELAEAVGPYLESQGYPVDLAVVAETAVRAARSAHDRAGLAVALRFLGQAERHRSRHDRALAAFTESLVLREELGQDGPVAEALHRIGDTHLDTERLEEAEATYLRSIAIFEEMGQLRDVAMVEVALAGAWLQAGRVDEATELIEGAVECLGADDTRTPPDRAGAWALNTLGAIRKANGRLVEAADCHRRSLASFRSRGERYGSAYALLNLGRCAAVLGQADEARSLYAESMRLFVEIGSTDGPDEVRKGLAELDRVPVLGAGGARRRRGRT
ncbi:MAG: ATP-binding protein [Acidimicrobiales bacterium]